MRLLFAIMAAALLAGCVEKPPAIEPATSPAPVRDVEPKTQPATQARAAPTRLPAATTPPKIALRFPPPDFTDHPLPRTSQPPPKADFYEYVDVIILAAALALASYLALKGRSRIGMVLLTIFCLAYFGFYREGCICPIGAIQNVTLAVFHSSYSIPIFVVAIFVLPLVFTLFFGRAFCAAVCPLGAIQDLVLIHPVKVPDWLAGSLRLLAYAYLGGAVVFAATGAGFIICRYDPFVAIFRLNGQLEMVALGVSFLAIALFVGRPSCRFFCPYGVLLGWLSRVAKWQVTITPGKCIQCGLCEDSCPFGAIRKSNVGQPLGRTQGKGVLALVLALFPVLVAAGAGAGYLFGPTMSRVHYSVRLADLVRQEQSGPVDDTTSVDSDQEQKDNMHLAFEVIGRRPGQLYAGAEAIRARYVTGGTLFGAFVGLMVGCMLIRMSVRRTRSDYEADRVTCLACARCFRYCPVHRSPQAELKEQEESE